MYTPSTTLRLALLRVFAEAGARSGDSLGFPAILRGWARTGMDDHELRVAVRELLESGELRGTQHDGVLAFALDTSTSHGPQRPHGGLRLAMAGASAQSWD
ncbi:MAG: hypothetical protein OSA97_07910 [Nevskia sp.]|nr:hypothetical protein [Nevskia sp.]